MVVLTVTAEIQLRKSWKLEENWEKMVVFEYWEQYLNKKKSFKKSKT